MSDELSVYGLARLADVASPDSSDSPGARWLMNVASAASEMIAECAEYGGDPADAAHETADAIVPVYTSEIWAVFCDLAAWNVDTSDYGQAEDMTRSASLALYVVAERLINELACVDTDDDDE